MGDHNRIECSKIASFQTTRTRKSALWLINNRLLEHYILGYAARYATRYEVKLYALAIEGSHIHIPAHFPNANRAFFMRDFNSSVARAVARHQPEYPGGALWGRKYSAEFLLGNEDIEDRFFYTVLQPVKDGLVDDIKDFPGYNCFNDATNGIARRFKVIRWKEYNDARRWNPEVSIDDFTEWHTLEYARLPGYEMLSQHEYATLMKRKLARRTAEILKKRAGKKCLGADNLRRIKPGTLAKNPKVSKRHNYRPRVLSKCPKRRAAGEAWYFARRFDYKQCSKRYRAGELDIIFPEGTYKPPLFTVAYSGSIL
jgi:hypothetical protein